MNHLNNNFNNFSRRKDAGIMLVKQCPLCHRNYQQDNFKILEEENYTFLAHLSCSNCGSHLIIRVMISPHGLVGTASVTDLQASEVLAFREEGAVSANEILDLVEIIKQDNLLERLTI